MKKITLVLSLLMFVGFHTSIAQNISSSRDSLSYAVGVNIGQNLKNQKFDSLSYDWITKGIQDYLETGQLQLSETEIGQVLTNYMMAKQKAMASEMSKAGTEFLKKNAQRPEVVSLPSGLQYEVLVEGNGPKPGPTDKVTTHYHGTLIDGSVFDSSVERGQPATFPVNGVIKGWQEALVMMPVGSKWKLYIPHHLAYGERGAGGKIGPYATLIFEIELISVN
jgi:FKBP-type peptidyl-prolyl cis-trans isomerase FklB